MTSTSRTRFLLRLVIASALAGLAFAIGVIPGVSQALGSVASHVGRVLDAPASALNLITPEPLQSGFSMQFMNRTYCFPSSTGVELMRYLRVGVPGWLVLLYAPAGLRMLAHRVRSRWSPRNEAAPRIDV